ncbi:MAG: cohesin domain-containing protein [Firmicutes bacterium]|nr:cohesin domain-containing protein [Bacillota bacterium]
MSIKKLSIRVMLILVMVTIFSVNVGTVAFADSIVTLNPDDKSSNVSLSNGDLTAEVALLGSVVRATDSKNSGKWYWEVKVDSGFGTMIGIGNANLKLDGVVHRESHNLRAYYQLNGNTYPERAVYGDEYKISGDTVPVIGVALDMDNGTIEFFKNGKAQGVAFSDIKSMGEVFPIVSTGSRTTTTTFNFGAKPFKYAIPEGFSSYDDSQQSEIHILSVKPEEDKIKIKEKVSVDLVINNISEIAAEDIKIEYDENKLEFLGFEEVDGMKLVKSIEETDDGELRVIIASEGESNIIDSEEILLKLEFRGIGEGEASIDIVKARVTDGIEMEKDLTEEECHGCIITIEGVNDVNNSGEFTLLDLGIDARHLDKDPDASELSEYNTDIDINNKIDEDDLIEIAKLMLENSSYAPNK